MSTADKYSLWIVPKGEPGAHIQHLIDALADTHNRPHFTPHLTVVANIFAYTPELTRVRERAGRISKQLKAFTLTLSGYAHKNEEFRCLYALAQSNHLAAIYELAAHEFPQVRDEHFADLPHLSLLYGNFSVDEKQAMITTLPKLPLSFEVSSLELYLTNGNDAAAWQFKESFPLIGF